jgi:DNA-binding NarL/FixJ family response regulator
VRCRVFLADDSEVVRRAIRLRLSAHPDLEIVGETETFAETIRLVPILKPRVVVLDIHLKDFETVKPLDFCAQAGYHCDIVGISIFSDGETELLAQKLGVKVFIDKINLAEELVPTILELCKDDPLLFQYT